MQTASDVRNEESAFEREAIPYMRRLYPAALRLTRQGCDAEDLLQETFTRAFMKFDQFTPGTNLGGWLYRVMLSAFYSRCRQLRRRPQEMLAYAPEKEVDRTAVAARSAEAEAIGELGDSKAVRALTRLPAAYRSVIYLADVESYRYSEIADVLGIPIGTVMSRVHRGRTMMRSNLSAQYAAQAPDTSGPAIPRSDRREDVCRAAKAHA